jgi:hypothetical protein
MLGSGQFPQILGRPFGGPLSQASRFSGKPFGGIEIWAVPEILQDIQAMTATMICAGSDEFAVEAGG